MDLTTKRNRERLKVRREPYWQRLSKGSYLGFRRGPDTWIARHRDRDGKQQYKALEGATEFDSARRAADSWLEQIGGVASRSAKRGTVKGALEAYLDWLREQGRDSTAKEAEGRFRLCVYDDPVASIRLEDATVDDFREWRRRLRVGRQGRSVNRHVRGVVAALNRALRLGFTGNPSTWVLEPLADDAEDSGETTVFLTSPQRQAIVSKASPALALFLRALEFTGARPGEMAEATVASLDTIGSSLTLWHRKGRPVRLRPRSVALESDAVEFFKGQTRRKLPGAFLFTDPLGANGVGTLGRARCGRR